VETYHKSVALRTDYETPAAVFDPLDAEFHFTLDVCATHKTAKCALCFTPEIDGLSQAWAPDVCWMNPPYGRAIREWMAKAYRESRSGATVVCLVPARTDSAWWHDYAMKGEVRFLRGRIKFVGEKWSAPYPCAVVIFRPVVAASNQVVNWCVPDCPVCDA
jgi:phage N-6-adenine-methyltransferase